MLKGFFQRLGSVFAGRKLDESLLEDLEEQLIMGDVSIETSQVLLDALREAARKGDAPTDVAALEVLRREVARMLSADADSTLHFAPKIPYRIGQPVPPLPLTVWLIVGVNGAGKTTTIGKLAHWLVSQGHRPLLAAGDTFRAAAVEQLQEWGRRAGVPVVAQSAGADPAAVTFDAIEAAKARGCDVVIVDTAGRLHTKNNLMAELAKIGRIIHRETGQAPQETLLVLDATTGQNGLAQAQAFTGSTPLTGLVLTKWDGTAKGGAVLTVAHQAGVPVKLVGTGEKAGDLQPFNAEAFAQEMIMGEAPTPAGQFVGE